ncbi:disulfide-isomerase [Olea europaea subsp. europaea]|uniref:Disulfide-isomerase n=1 Tax=Olea europaea subsp. europaea TaxID=158383 RepID=A0A8S0PDD1_OLEEU|nr:disulfide-isomerase [Olea europaea subsp. europaea]
MGTVNLEIIVSTYLSSCPLGIAFLIRLRLKSTSGQLKQDGNVQPYKKSEPISEANNELVTVVVVENLQDMVLNSGKNGEHQYSLLDHLNVRLFTFGSAYKELLSNIKFFDEMHCNNEHG